MSLPKISLGTVWMVLPIMLLLLMVWTNTNYPLDFWMHANQGRFMWQQQAWVQADTFTHTISGQPVLNQPWLAQLGMYLTVTLGGYKLAQFVAGLIYAFSFVILAWITRRGAHNARVTAALVLLSVAVSAENLGVRPQALSAMLFALLLALLWTWAPRWWTIVGVAVIELLWTNVHGAFPLGIVLPSIFLTARCLEVAVARGLRNLAADKYVRCYLGCCLAAALLMFANPHGLRAIEYVAGVTSHSTSRQLEEWLPPTLGTMTGATYYGSIVVVLAILVFSKRRKRLRDLLLLAALLFLASRSQRMVIWWAMALPPILAPYCAALVQRWCRAGALEERSKWNLLALCALALFTMFATPWTRTSNPLLPSSKRQPAASDTPSGAANYLAIHDYRGRLYQPMEWGAYMTWALDPRAKVFVDSRVDFFPDTVWNDYVQIGTQPDQAEQLLDAYGVDAVVWDRRRAKVLVEVLQHSGQWQQVYQDPLAIVFFRKEMQ